MFIFWGKRIVRTRIGYVADFCPICRCKCAFEMVRVGAASRICPGDGELVGHERKCLDCRTPYRAKTNAYASIEKTKTPLDELTRRTFPAFEEALRGRLELENRVEQDPSSLAPHVRQELIRAPIFFLSPVVERRFASAHLDKEVGLSLVATVALLMAMPAVLARFAPDAQQQAPVVALLLGALLVCWQGSGVGRRYVRREIVPRLARSLRPLRPRETELRTLLADLKRRRHTMGHTIRLDDLLAHMAVAAPASEGFKGS